MKIAIIGAGASGLAALKHGLDEGHTCVVFEQTGHIGGIWRYVEKVGTDEFGLPIRSSMYEHLRTNTPKEAMEFENFPYRNIADYSYVSHQEVLRYIEDYAESFALLPHIKFYHHTVAISPLPEKRWLIEVRDLKKNECYRKEFDCVMICSGQFSDPVTPQLPGMDKFKGRIIHSHVYRKPDCYKETKVLVVGFSHSGIDICRKLCGVAKKVFLSFRLPVKCAFAHLLPDSVIRKPEIKEFYEYGVKFIDDSVEEFDDVIFCTGYRISFPFLTPECDLLVEDNFVRYLYKHTINVKHPTMAIIGLPKNLTLFPMFCVQARFFFAFLARKFKVTEEEMMADIEKYIVKCEEDGQSPDINIHGEARAYLGDLAQTANIKGTKPVIFNLFEFLVNGAFGKYDLAYKIINDEEFECFQFDNNVSNI